MKAKFLRPKEPSWAIAAAMVALAALLCYRAAMLFRFPSPGRGAGLVFGCLAAALFVVEALYPVRRKLLGRPLGNARRWIQLHIWGGLLGALFVLFHEGFRRPGGTLGWLLLLLTIWVAVSGFIGVCLQKYYPYALSQNLSVEALFERIPELVGKLAVEAEARIAGASDILDSFYRSEMRPALAEVAPSWEYLADVSGGRDRQLAGFVRIAQFLSEEEKATLEDLKTIFIEKLELDAQYSVQRVLRGWTILHVPPAALLLALLAAHIGLSLLY